MPMAALSPCRVPGCAVLGPCPTHGRVLAREKAHRRPHWNVQRWYYRVEWVHPVRGLRAQVLRENPLCVQCQAEGRVTVAVDVDHIIPHAGDWARFSDRGNLQGLCRAHHTQKSRRE